MPFSCARLPPPEFGHMPFCHQLSFPPLLPPCRHLHLFSAYSCVFEIVALVIYLALHHHHYICNTNNNTITAICSSMPLLSLRLSPSSICLVCKFPKLLYDCFHTTDISTPFPSLYSSCVPISQIPLLLPLPFLVCMTPDFIYRCPRCSAILCPF